MRGPIASGVLSLLVIGTVEALPRPATPRATTGSFTRGRELMTAGSYVEAADAFHEYLQVHGLSKFTIRVAVYCDVSNLDNEVRGSENPPDLFLLRRPVRDQLCWGLYWGLFSSRAEAKAATGAVPARLRNPDQGSAAISGILVPIEIPIERRTTPASTSPAAPLQGARSVTRVPRPPGASEPTEREGAAALPTPDDLETVVALPPETPVETPPQGTPSALGPHGSSATAPRAELFTTYSYLWDDRISRIVLVTDSREVVPLNLKGSLPLGWLFAGSVNVADRIGIVGEVSGSYGTQDLARERSGFRVSVLAAHAGLRYTDRDDRVATPYGQALVGATRLSEEGFGLAIPASLGGPSAAQRVLVPRKATHLSIQAGVGVIFGASEWLGIVVGGDYRLVFRRENDRDEFRVHAGVVFRVGHK